MSNSGHDSRVDVLKKALYVFTPYCLLASFLYMFGYWKALSINIFEWITFSDIAAYSVVPLVVRWCPEFCGK